MQNVNSRLQGLSHRQLIEGSRTAAGLLLESFKLIGSYCSVKGILGQVTGKGRNRDTYKPGLMAGV